MTAVPVRDTPFACWKDPDAWMERMKGPEWNATLQKEASIVHAAIQEPAVKKRLSQFTAAFAVANDTRNVVPFECGPAYVTWHSNFMKSWRFRGSDTEHTARDIVSNGEDVWVTVDKGDGAEAFELQCWTSACTTKPAWTHFPVGPDVALVGEKLYSLGVKNKLIYYQLWSCDARTGKHRTLVYEEKNPTFNLSLDKQPDKKVYFMKEQSQTYTTFELTEKGLHPVNIKHPMTRRLVLPLGAYGIDFFWERLGLLITKQHGKKTLWHCTSKHSAKKLLEIPAGQIQIDPYAAEEGRLPCLVRVDPLNSFPVFYSLDSSCQLSLLFPVVPTGLEVQRISAKSLGNTTVHGVLSWSKAQKPRYLLMVGYGAYGMETAVGSIMKRWAPLIQNGWAIGYTFLRGGGDHTDEWAKEGRCDGRKKTLADFKFLIKEAQRTLHIPAEHTAIYGRSAGGLLMGGTLAQNPYGSLMSAVYTEVPYVDELRTTTNPSLPLTALEYGEFGNPAVRLEDFISVGLLSPADSAATTGAPNIFVLTRTAENDSQVYAYESVKWIRRLRSHDKKGDAPKLCIVEKNQGHFTPPEKTIQQWALDCSLLDAWIHNEF
jgi:hypothetical protein